MSSISFINGGIEIDAGHADLSANIHDGMIEVAIGAGYANGTGYAEYQEFRLTATEAIALRDWLTDAIRRTTMGTMVATYLPIVLEALKHAPEAINAAQDIIAGARHIWESVTAEDPPTPEQRAQYDDAEAAAFAALMKSTEDVAKEGESGAV